MADKKFTYLNRDLSWLSFNHRVLLEAGDESVPLYSRIQFLSIFSSNLDEFFRVRMPSTRELRPIHEVSASRPASQRRGQWVLERAARHAKLLQHFFSHISSERFGADVFNELLHDRVAAAGVAPLAAGENVHANGVRIRRPLPVRVPGRD